IFRVVAPLVSVGEHFIPHTKTAYVGSYLINDPGGFPTQDDRKRQLGFAHAAQVLPDFGIPKADTSRHDLGQRILLAELRAGRIQEFEALGPAKGTNAYRTHCVILYALLVVRSDRV